MDIREIDGLWCDDITFCPERCGWTSCPRNKENIRDKTIPHSFSVEIPQDCPKKQEGRRSGIPDREKVIKELHDARRYLEDKEWSDRGASPHIDAINDALDLLKEQEAVVRCKDCKYWYLQTTGYHPNRKMSADETGLLLRRIGTVLTGSGKIRERSALQNDRL